jgi:hypothetical protein
MQPQQIDLASLSLEQLKALAYDQIVILNATQANINLLQAEIQNRIQAQAATQTETPGQPRTA